MISEIGRFIDYYESIRRRTLTYVRALPPDQLDWSPKPGEYTCAELVRHLAASEQMFVGVVVDSRWRYPGHETGPTRLEELIAWLEQGHTTAMTRLKTVSDTDLGQPRPSLQGPSVRAWRWLMAMVEHEIHHRSQLAMYLMLLGVQPPHIFGLGVEDLIAQATG